MRTAFFIILLLHALIHLMGFIKGFQLAEIKELHLPVSRTGGLFWLLAAGLLLISAALFFMKNEFWWVPAIAGALLSQVLVILWWQDAKAGTAANALVLLVAASSWGTAMFDRGTSLQIDAILNVHAGTAGSLITMDDLAHLPEPVSRWLNRSGVLGHRRIRAVQLSQTAQMKMRPEQEKWYGANAGQTFVVNEPSFVWTVRMYMNPFMEIQGRDVFQGGKGSMKIKMDGLVSLVDASGPRIDEGTLQRYLGEMVWFPTAAIDPAVRWEQTGVHSARATLKVGETEGSGEFHFNEAGDMVRFEAMRFYGNEPDAKRYPWVITSNEFADPAGLRIPVDMEATWRFEDREWTWLKLRLDSISYTY